MKIHFFIFLFLILSLWEAPAFGPEGHHRIFEESLVVLKATERRFSMTPWPNNMEKRRALSNYPDGAVTYALNGLTDIVKIFPGALLEYWKTLIEIQDGLNSSDHYYNPKNISQTSDPSNGPPLVKEPGGIYYKIYYYLPGMKNDFDEYCQNPIDGFDWGTIENPNDLLEKLQLGADGQGYNIISSMLYYLNGRADNSNPSGNAPTKGFVPLAKEENLEEAFIALGCAIHYMGDLFSPGHTEWSSWWQLAPDRFANINTDSIPTFHHPDHKDFDNLGDTIDYKTILKQNGITVTIHPQLILSYEDNGNRCATKGKKNLDVSQIINKDIPDACHHWAKISREYWENKPNIWEGNDFKDDFKKDFSIHMKNSVALCAGMIDWAFSMAAPDDYPYHRDATNFYGMAEGLLKEEKQEALITASKFFVPKGSLGGVDQDDYFPITNNTLRYIHLSIQETGLMLGAQAYITDSPMGDPKKIADLPLETISSSSKLELDLGQAPPKEFILRVYTPSTDNINYEISFSNDSLSSKYQWEVKAVQLQVNQGEDIRFEGSVKDNTGAPVAMIQIGVEDPVAQQSKSNVPSLKTDFQGKFSYKVATVNAKAGMYSFVFFCPESQEKVVVICLSDPQSIGKKLPEIQVPIGTWGSVSESLQENPGAFVTITRTTTGMFPPSATFEMIEESQKIGESNISYWEYYAREFAGNPVNDIAVVVAIGSCALPEVTVSKAVCAGSLTYLKMALAKTAVKTYLKQQIDLSNSTEKEKEEQKLLVDAGDTIISAATLDPNTGVVGWSEASTAWKTAKIYVTTKDISKSQGGAPPQAPAAAPLPAQNQISPLKALNMTITFTDSNQVVNYSVVPISQSQKNIGMLDCVFCIDKSGSMMDDINTVKEQSDNFLKLLSQYCTENNISFQIGLITYCRHDDPVNWLEYWPMTSDVAKIRQNISEMTITNANLGNAGNEDTYAALSFGMDLPVQGKVANMGWRQGAAKIILPITDEPPDDPDFEKRTMRDVVKRAAELDPVHFYPLLLPKPTLGFLDPAIRALDSLATATDGKITRIRNASELPQALVSTIKLAVERHKREVWRKEHPPYTLFAVAIGMGCIIILASLFLLYKAITAKNIQKRKTPIL